MNLRHAAVFLGLFFGFASFGESTAPAGPSVARAQRIDATGARGSGFELALTQAPRVFLGDTTLNVSALAVSTHGLVNMTPAREGTPVLVRVTGYDRCQPNDRNARPLSFEHRANVSADGVVAVAMPIANVPFDRLNVPRLVIVLGASPGRSFEFPITVEAGHSVDLLTDRALYERGESIHVWSRMLTTNAHTPVVGGRLAVELRRDSGERLANTTIQTDASGVGTFDFPIAQSLAEGGYVIAVRSEPVTAAACHLDSFAPREKSVRVGRRTFERLLVEARATHPVVAPAQLVEGVVTVNTPSGVGVRDARVVATDPLSGQSVDGTTDDDGRVTLRMRAEAQTAVDVALAQWVISVEHPGYGSARSVLSYRIARVPVLFEVRASNGALVPETQSEILLSATRPDGEPIEPGTELRITGPALGGATRVVRTDAHGFAIVALRLRTQDVVVAREGTCAGQPSTALDVSLETPVLRTARVCVPVASESLVRIKADAANVHDQVGFSIERRAAASNARVYVELMHGSAIVASTWVAANDTHGTLPMPQNATGIFVLRARPLGTLDVRAPLNVASSTLFGAGSLEAVLARPATFSLSLSAERDPYAVRETAVVVANVTQPTPSNEPRFIALVARDLAAHGGEADWKLDFVTQLLSEAETRNEDQLALRGVLWASLARDVIPMGVAPIDLPPWGNTYRDGPDTQLLRDPVVLGAQLLRQQIGHVFMQIEAFVASVAPREADFLEARGTSFAFKANALEALSRRGSPSWTAVGGEPLTIAALYDADTNFDFDHAARRITRQRLVSLLGALSRLTDPTNVSAARMIETLPPSRWLALLPLHAGIDEALLRDAWGRPFELRAAQNHARFVLSERAPNVELVSAGADARFGTSDDVRDPFERILPKGTLYAITSGEDALMRQLSSTAPGELTLRGMLNAYAAVSVAMIDEARAPVVRGQLSEQAQMDDGVVEDEERSRMEPTPAAPSMMAMGALGGGSGEGYGSGAGMAMRRRGVASENAPGSAADEDMRQDANARRGFASLSSRFAEMGERARERFPATLAFIASKPLTGESTRIEVPLADALTTYRVEAIAWSSNGWTSLATTELHVDQPAVVDAPIPPVATRGDVLHIPFRVSNRTRGSISLTLQIEATGSLRFAPAAPRVISVRANDASVENISITCTEKGEGNVIIKIVDDAGRVIDAVSRPMRVDDDVRVVRAEAESLVADRMEARLVLPASAQPYETSELRILDAFAFFGLPTEWGPRTEPLLAAWLYAALDRQVPAALSQSLEPTIETTRYGMPFRFLSNLGFAIGAAWNDPSVEDEKIERALAELASAMPTTQPGAGRIMPPQGWSLRDGIHGLIGFAPALTRSEQRPRLAASLRTLSARISVLVAEGALESGVDTQTQAFAAYALISIGADRARVDELLRRVERSLVRFDRAAFIDGPAAHEVPSQRLGASAAYALTRLALGQRDLALPILRDAISLRDAIPQWDAYALAFETLLASRLGGSFDVSSLHASVDGEAIAMHQENGAVLALSQRLAQAGEHSLVVDGFGEAMGLARLTLRYAVPWSEPPASRAPIGIEWSGAVGPRDGVAGLRVEIRNRGARTIAKPVVEIDLPAGAELDQQARQLLAQQTAEPPTMEGRRLRLVLRPLTPSSWIRIPLPVRWTLSGTLHGLGTSVQDAALLTQSVSRPTAIVPSQEIVVADEGAAVSEGEGATRAPTPPVVPFVPEVIR